MVSATALDRMPLCAYITLSSINYLKGIYYRIHAWFHTFVFSLKASIYILSKHIAETVSKTKKKSRKYLPTAIISSGALWDILLQGEGLSQQLMSSRPSSPQHFTMANIQAWSIESNTWLRSPFNLRVPSSWKSLLPGSDVNQAGPCNLWLGVSLAFLQVNSHFMIRAFLSTTEVVLGICSMSSSSCSPSSLCREKLLSEVAMLTLRTLNVTQSDPAEKFSLPRASTTSGSRPQ